MTIQISDNLAQQAKLDEKSATLELALTLYAQERISASQVRGMCGLGYFEFEKIVSARGLPTCFMSDDEAEQELATIRKLRTK
jgi:predicted HTH domain antitoxin